MHCIWSNTSSVNIVTIHFKTLTRMTGKWQLVWRTPDGRNSPLPNISHRPYKCRSVHITVQGALDISSWPHVRVLFTDVCAQCSLNVRLSWSPGSYLHGCMCSPRPPNVHSAKCKVQMCSIVGRILFALDLALPLDQPSGADVVLCESFVISLFLLFVLCWYCCSWLLLTLLFILLLVLLNVGDCDAGWHATRSWLFLLVLGGCWFCFVHLECAKFWNPNCHLSIWWEDSRAVDKFLVVCHLGDW